ncbi:MULTISPECIES: amino acid ABC transporter permease [Weissella]|uniref:Glutamate transport membrane-spanning protein n=3 Tax=Weissella TaxID=46255 RepID=A0A1L6R9K9_9LACO|nr:MULTISPECIES: amino acid ABC transporter permease [Weissella]CCC56408.1 amino acid ABC superfamily ATP binding cassette transporter, membrane protein [Weissella thailandensis fsh4-2]APS41182.1 Glutamate transport membrane-spanning protein [Weissella jogaejeotgali]NKY90775.1 amino acid ABC transporter permease [Weissella thailandensis]RDS59826.1 amino acid ABC transporter permease [Weissella thailandensis]GEP74285.1 glutamine ABC transporter permease [Weissella thailandensis]
MSGFFSAFSWVNMRFLMMGLGVTIQVAVVSIVLSFIIGSVLGVIRYVKIPYFSQIVGFIIDLIRNLPLLLIIFFTYFALPKVGIHFGVVTSTIFALTIFESAMLAEIIRSGILAVPKGQLEGALSNGLNFKQALWHIILPQAYKKMIPPIVSQFVSLIKDTSLATIIMLPEVTYRAQIVYAQEPSAIISMFCALAVIYFILNFIISKIGDLLDRRMTA